MKARLFRTFIVLTVLLVAVVPSALAQHGGTDIYQFPVGAIFSDPGEDSWQVLCF